MKLIVGNQKTTMNKENVLDFIATFRNIDCKDAVICSSFPYIEIYNDKSKFKIGAQNVSSMGNGATTGEVSAEQLKSFNVEYCIVGHSERRKYQNEMVDDFCNKLMNLLSFDITPIFCVGENLDEKKSGITKDVIGKQILEVYDKLDKDLVDKIIVAYEPVWAIGTGLTPSNDEIIDAIQYIKDLINDKYDAKVLVLYGGSVSKKNIMELNTIEIVDGYLIGGASTKKDEFIYIINSCKDIN